MYEKILKRLQEKGFIIKLIYGEGEYSMWQFENDSVLGCVCNDKGLEYDQIGRYNNSICMDNKECFNKWSHCPVILNPEDSEEFMENLFKEIEFLGSEEGERLSDEYEYTPKYTIKYEKVNYVKAIENTKTDIVTTYEGRL